MEDDCRGFDAAISPRFLNVWPLSLRLLAVASHTPCSRRRLEFLAAKRKPLVRDDRYLLSALHALLAEELIARAGKIGGTPAYRLTPAGERYRTALEQLTHVL